MRFIFLLLPFILLFATGCKKGQLIGTTPSNNIDSISHTILDYNAQTMQIETKATITNETIEPLHRLYFFTNATCNGAPLDDVVAQDFPTHGVQLTLYNRSASSIYFRTDTNTTCYFGFTYTPSLDPVPSPTFTSTIPASPSTTDYQPAITGLAVPRSATIDFYSDATCTTSIGTGTSIAFGNQGIRITVPQNTVSPVYSQVTDPRGIKSACALLTNYEHNSNSAAAIQFVSSTPTSPNKTELNPIIRISASPTIQNVRLYSDAACLNQLADQDAASASNPGISITVNSNHTTHIYSVATNDNNESTPCSYLTTYIHDNIAPAAPTYTSTTPASPTRLTTLPYVTGTLPADASMVRFYTTSNCTVSVGFGTRAQYLSSGATANLPANTTTSIYAKSVDGAGNESACTYLTFYKHNNIPPLPPAFDYAIPASPTNASTTPTVFGTATVTTERVYLYSNETCTSDLGNSTGIGFSTSGIIIPITPNDETIIYGVSEDLEGNRSDCTTLTSYLHSTQPAPNPNFSATYPPSPSRTTTVPYVAGTVSNTVTTIELTLDPTCTTMSSSGTRSAFVTSGIPIAVSPNGISTIYGRSTDYYGNISACTLLTSYTHTNLPPLNPIFTSITPLSPSKSSYTPTIFGSAFNNIASPLTTSIVRIYDGNTCSAKVGEGTPTAFSSTGISLNVTQNGITHIYARAFDSVSNASDCVFMTTYIHNALKPGKPLFLSLSQPSPSYTPQSRIMGNYDFSTDFMQRTSIVFYTDTNCTNELQTNAAANFITPGIDIAFPTNTTTPLSAASFNEVGTSSDCSNLVSFRHYDTAPINLALTVRISGTIVASWTPDSVANPAPTYALKRATTSGGPYTIVYTGPSPSYTDYNITNGKAYYYVVQASNSSGQTVNSAEVTTTATSVAPVAGASLSAIPGAQRVQLTWTGFNQNMGYLIYRATQSGGPYTELAARPTANNYIDQDVSNNVGYYYIVKGYNASGKSITSNEVRVVPLALPPSPNSIWAVPQLQSADCGGSPGLHIFWSSPPYYQSYHLRRRVLNVSGQNFDEIVATNSYVDCNPYEGYRNTYSARALWGSIYTNYTPTLEFYPGTTSLSVNPGDTYINLNWSAHEDATDIQVFRSEDANGPFELYASLGPVSSFKDTSIVIGKAYYYYVQAREGANILGWPSEQLSGVAGPNPTQPTNLTGFVNAAGSTELSWTIPSHFNNFAIYRASAAGGPFSFLKLSSTNNSTDFAPLTGLNYYRVVTRWGDHESAPSNTITVRRNSVSSISALTYVDRIDLTWSNLAGSQDYELERATSSSGPFMAIAYPTGNSYSDTGATIGQGYYYRVRARYADLTQSQYSNLVSAIREPTVNPTGFSVTAVTGSSISVQWVKTPAAEKYVLYSATSVGGPYTAATTTAGNNIVSYTFTGLNTRTQYFLKVATKISTSEYPSDPISAATLATPAAPTGIVGNNRITLSWGAITGVNTWDLERSSDGVSFSPLTSGLGTTNYQDNSVLNGQKYFYRVTANYTLGSTTSPSSVPYSPGHLPNIPSGLSVMNNSTGINVSLGWATVAGATTYKVYRSNNELGPFSVAITTPANRNVFVTGLTPGVPVYFHVTALTGDLESSPSNTIGVLPTTNAAAPIALYAGTQSVQINWSAIPGASTYHLYRSPDGINFELLASNLATTSYTDTGVTAPIVYYYYQPLPTTGSLKLSASSISLPVALEPIPLKPTTFSLTSPNVNSVRMDWETIPQVTYYEIYRSTTSGSGYTQIATVNAPITTYSDSSITIGTTYYYTMRAFTSSAVPSPYADEKSITLDSVPTGLSAMNNGPVIDLTWSTVAGASSYRIWRSESSGANYAFLNNSATTSYSDTTAEPNIHYYYVVAAIFPNGVASSYSNEADVIKNGALNFTHAIELLDRGISSRLAANHTFERSRTSFNTTHYDGTISYAFEVVASNTDSTARSIALVDDSNAAIATISVPPNTIEPTRLSAVFTPVAGAQNWRIHMEGSTLADQLSAHSARVFVKQMNASKTRIYIPLLSSSEAPSLQDLDAPVVSTQNTAFSMHAANMPYRRQVQQLSRLSLFNAWTLETLVARTNGAEGTFALYNSSKEVTVTTSSTEFNTSAITQAKVQINEGATGFATANEDDLYNIALRCRVGCAAGSVNLYKAGLWVSIENITKIQLTIRTSLASSVVSTNTTLDSVRTFITTSDYSNPVIFWETTATANSGGNMTLLNMGANDNGTVGGIPFTASSLTFNPFSVRETMRTSAITPVSNMRYLPSITTSDTFQTHGSAFILNISF